MESILVFVLIVLVIWAISYFSNRERESPAEGAYYGPPQLKFVDETHKGIELKMIFFRGLLPSDREMNMAYALSAFDITDGENNRKPVFSFMSWAQEPDTICYQISGNFGQVSKGTVITDWIDLGVIVPDFIQPAHSGNRKINIILHMFDSDKPPTIRGGWPSDMGEEYYFLSDLIFNHEFKEKGYEEESKDREEAQAISLKIGVAVAMADSSLDDKEGEILKKWIIKEISGYSGSRGEELKKVYNNALKEGYAEAKRGDLSLSKLSECLSEVGDKKTKYDAIELCMDVMAADGVADPEEMSVIRNIARVLDLDMDEIEKMRDKVTLGVSTGRTSEQGLESLVGIELSWSDEKKRKHLRSEFQKWSNRLNSLPEGEERDRAQRMLDGIAVLRKKYA